MREELRLLPIPTAQFPSFRREVILECLKWDPQVGDTSTISDHVAVLDAQTAQKLKSWAEALAHETEQMERVLTKRPELYKALGLPHRLRQLIGRASWDPKANLRLMRFDFHPTTDGWAVSEVNSDVPGGMGEASRLGPVACKHFPHLTSWGNPGRAIAQGFSQLLPQKGKVALVHATAYSDDRQVMEYLAQDLKAEGFEPAFLAPDHIAWRPQGPVSLAWGQEGPLAGVLRFYPAEWLPLLPRASQWEGFFAQSAPACNHPMALLTQSKRLPLVWDQLGVDLPVWKELLPQTQEPRPIGDGAEWILKPTFGRVGEAITIPEVTQEKERKAIANQAKYYPLDWVAQKRFISRPLPTDAGERHLCIGVFTVNGRAVGFYGRLGMLPRIDQHAQDIAILIQEGEAHE